MPKRIQILLSAVLVCTVLAVAAIFLFGTNAGGRILGTAKPTPNPKLIIDPNAGPSPTPSPTAPGIAIPGWAGLSLPAGVTEAEVPLYNPDANQDWYYLTFELQLKETGEVIFSTGLIPPGLYCNKVTLSRPLEIGTYECTMVVQPYFIREVPTPTNNAVFDIKVSVF
ncbi:MAG: hypothetical protein E7318_00020 [Clostridiales bacterium]|nr:hypothetical protein [Clostridiales bacterium]